MRVHFESRATIKPRGEAVVSKLVKKSLSNFFGHCDPPVDAVKLTAFKIGPGGDPKNLIKMVHTHPDFGHNPIGLPVIVYTEGTQGLTALMEIEGKSTSETISLVAGGPYLRKKRAHCKMEEGCSESSPYAESSSASEEEAVAPVADSVPKIESQSLVDSETSPNGCPSPDAGGANVENPSEPPQVSGRVIQPFHRIDGRTVHQRLLDASIPEEEIERLRVTVASIIYREIGDQEVPDWVQVPVVKITQAILEHMKLPTNEAGTYRGVIGNFYSNRISMLALKLSSEDSFDPEATYTDWLFERRLVLDFVGGKDKLAALTRGREKEIAERIAEEQKPKVPAPTAEEVGQMVLEPFAEDAEVLRIASRMVIGLRAAEEKLEQAAANEQGALDEVARVEEMLRIARENLQVAAQFKQSAAEEVDRFTLPDDVRRKVLEAKTRIDALVKDLGM